MAFDTIGVVILAYQKCRLFGRGGHGFGVWLINTKVRDSYFVLYLEISNENA
jgi:hypothetical protein